jgi:hypothetical protein
MTRNRKPVDAKMWADITRQLHNQGIAEFQTKNLTEEEEQQYMRSMFQDVWNAGYTHMHTLHIVPLDSDRQPYDVHIDDLERK